MEEDEVESRDWAEMPSDALSAVFGKLDLSDLLTGAGLVCCAWRRLAANNSTLWRRLDMTHHGDIMETEEAEAMARAAVDRAAGTLEAFWADTFVTDGLLRYISERSQQISLPYYLHVNLFQLMASIFVNYGFVDQKRSVDKLECIYVFLNQNLSAI